MQLNKQVVHIYHFPNYTRQDVGKSYSDLSPSIYSTKNVSHMVVILWGKIHIHNNLVLQIIDVM